MSSKLKNLKNTNSGATVNMASVVPNPKLISTNLGNTQFEKQKTLADKFVAKPL
jgi:hypothetical protein